MSHIEDCRVLELPKVSDPRGNLTFLEGGRHIPFDIHRVYWIYDVPGGAVRGGHAYWKLHEVFISLSGSFNVVVSDGRERRTYTLNRSYTALYVPNLLWRHLESFSTNAVCLIVASLEYSEDDYIVDEEAFRLARRKAR